ncbi:hypothetical protein ACNPQK_18560 [Acinetobacter guillouiae]|uniref:hypothetical protein n=1 Tax=Acinetobacter guillouiae TaxID=106649 RepID=UPI003AF4D285
MIKAFNLISKSRRFIAFPQGGGFYDSLTLADIKSYFDVYGCDLDRGLFVKCIFALDGKYLSEVNKA